MSGNSSSHTHTDTHTRTKAVLWRPGQQIPTPRVDPAPCNLEHIESRARRTRLEVQETLAGRTNYTVRLRSTAASSYNWTDSMKRTLKKNTKKNLEKKMSISYTSWRRDYVATKALKTIFQLKATVSFSSGWSSPSMSASWVRARCSVLKELMNYWYRCPDWNCDRIKEKNMCTGCCLAAQQDRIYFFLRTRFKEDLYWTLLLYTWVGTTKRVGEFYTLRFKNPLFFLNKKLGIYKIRDLQN